MTRRVNEELARLNGTGHGNLLFGGLKEVKRSFNTAQTCSRCLHLGVRPNQSKFQCRDCGYQINADLNGAKSVAQRHDLVARGRYYCEYPLEEVNRPEAIRSSEKKRQVRNLKPQAPSKRVLALRWSS
jgi:transposase